jgi:anti-sigma B factor antagonist
MSEEDEHVSNDDLDQVPDADQSSAPPGDSPQTATDLSVEVRTRGDRTILAVDGDLDLYTAPILRDRVLAAADDTHAGVIIDLTEVPFMDSSGLGVIVGCLKRVREAGGDLVLVTKPGSAPTKLLSLTGLDRAIPTFATIDEALD